MVHALFGYCLMAAGLARIIEVCFLLSDQPTGNGEEATSQRSHPSSAWFPIRAFQHLPIWLLFASGCIFMSATDEELRWADSWGVDSITWGLIDFSLSFLLFFWVNVLVDLYVSEGGRYGSRNKNAAQAQSGSASLLETATSTYARLSTDDFNEDRTAIGSGESANNSHNSFELDRVNKQGRRINNAEKREFTLERGEEDAQHVLFDNEDVNDENGDDPFDDERRQQRHRP